MMHHAVAWFEVPVVDFDRAKRFYSTIFDYTMPEMTFGTLRMGFFLYERDKGGIGGAIVHHPEHYRPSADGVKVYLSGGKDLSTVLDRVEAAGGRVLQAKKAIGEHMGHMALFKDSEGNVLALHSPE
ncbi:MAG: VOC family protein [Flavobacteriales bacterium]|nr:VOC family protein [Flavobacteriales bacterium]